MAIQRLTDSDDGTSWVDAVPGPVESGYTAQNTNITARTNGLDSTTLEVLDASTVRIKQGGVVDVDGVPYLVGADTDVTLVSAESLQYIAMVDDTATTKVAQAVEGPTTWNPAKNTFETATGDRVLDWRISVTTAGTVATHTLTPPESSQELAPGGICRGGEYVIAEAGTQSVEVIHSGLYEVFAIGGGSDGAGSVDGGGGGGCAAAHVRLYHGETLAVSLTAGGVSSVVLGTTLSLTGQPGVDDNGGGGLVSGTRGRVWDNTTTGGNGGTGQSGTTTTVGGHGGGAGPRHDGLRGEVGISATAPGAQTRASRFEGAGEGGTASLGAVVIKYRSI